MRYKTAHLTIFAFLVLGLLAASRAAFSDTAVLIRGSNLDRGIFDQQILLPNAKMLDVGAAVQAMKGIRYQKADIVYRGTGGVLNLSTVNWISLTDLVSNPDRHGLMVYDPAYRELLRYSAYVAKRGLTNPTLSSVLARASVIGVLPDDTFLRPQAFSFPRPTGDTTPPVVAAPAPITVAATQADGALPSASPPLTAFLAGGSATDTGDASPIRLAPQLGGINVIASTLFPIGVSTVTFRYQDHSGNVGSATSAVTVILGQPRLSGAIAAKGWVTAGVLYYVDLRLTNTGTGNARNISITSLPLRTLSGTGVVTLNSPPLPIAVGNLDVGGSTTLHILLNIPSTVTRFSITETGNVQNVAGTTFSYSIAQSVIP